MMLDIVIIPYFIDWDKEVRVIAVEVQVRVTLRETAFYS